MDNSLPNSADLPGLEIATLGGGCFWCLEAIFAGLKGVSRVTSGYSGGLVDHPSYEQICTGSTGHAEVVQVTFESKVISFKDLLGIFFHTHDPTTLNRQGADAGTQYRSAIFYHTPEQKEVAEETIREIQTGGLWNGPVVTEVTRVGEFYPAEDYHQDYYKMNPDAPYCRMVIEPKLSKLREHYLEKLKK